MSSSERRELAVDGGVRVLRRTPEEVRWATPPGIPVVTPLSGQVYEWLKERIFTGGLGANERLSIDALAAEIGVSRTPVRDAVNRLAQEGLVVVHPRRGTVVGSLTVAEIRDAFEARYLIEPVVCAEAAEMASDELIDDLTRLQEEAERIDLNAVYTNFPLHSRYAELDAAFHVGIAQSLGNPKIVQILEGLNIQRRVAPLVFGSDYRGPELRIAEHRAILDALTRRDPIATREAVSHHIGAAKVGLIAFLAASEASENQPGRSGDRLTLKES